MKIFLTLLTCSLYLGTSSAYSSVNEYKEHNIAEKPSAMTTVVTGASGAVIVSPLEQEVLENDTKIAVIDQNGHLIGIKSTPDQQQEFEKGRLSLIKTRMAKALPSAIFHALWNKNRIDSSDEVFNMNLNQARGGLITRDSETGQPVVDLLHYQGLPTLPDHYLHPVKIVANQVEDHVEVDHILIKGEKITSRDGRDWELAKIHAYASWAHDFLYVSHGLIHFVNHIYENAARTTLSSKNPLGLFLKPHFNIGIPLDEFNYEYLNTSYGNPTSVPFNSMQKLFSKGFTDYKEKGKKSLEPTYYEGTVFNRALTEAYKATEQHVASFMNGNISASSGTHLEEISAFFEAIHKVIPFCPNGTQAKQEFALTQTQPSSTTKMIARIIFEGSFLGSAEHNTFLIFSYFGSLYNVHQPFVRGGNWKMGDLFWHQDIFKRVLFFNAAQEDGCEQLLHDVQYDRSLKLDVSFFKSNLEKLAKKYPQIFPLDRVSANVDI